MKNTFDGTDLTRPYKIPGFRVALVRESTIPADYNSASSSYAASNILNNLLEDVDREVFVVLMLNQKNKVIGVNKVSIGTVNAALVQPREVFKPAFLAGAVNLVLGHNHPSGDCTPSVEDNKLTKRLVEVGKLLGISVIDHVIVAGFNTGYYSYADNGAL